MMLVKFLEKGKDPIEIKMICARDQCEFKALPKIVYSLWVCVVYAWR